MEREAEDRGFEDEGVFLLHRARKMFIAEYLKLYHDTGATDGRAFWL
jgi:hypothetical protein